MRELELTGWNIHNSKLMANVRSMEQLDKCTDEHCVILAESIRDQRILGRPTMELEERLSKRMSAMFSHTRAFFGKLPIEVYPSTSHLSIDSLNDTTIENLKK